MVFCSVEGKVHCVVIRGDRQVDETRLARLLGTSRYYASLEDELSRSAPWAAMLPRLAWTGAASGSWLIRRCAPAGIMSVAQTGPTFISRM